MPDTRALEAAARIDWSRVPEEQVAGGLARRVVQTTDFTLVHYTYPPGATFRRHAHPEAQLTGVIRGRITFAVQGAQHVLEPGDWLYIPGGAAHSARVEAGEPVVTMNIFTPPRRSFPDAQ